MKCVILQPSFLPWRGYFHQIQKADVFVFYDDVQYDKGGWRNRNRFKTVGGTTWLTVPVFARGATVDRLEIRDVRMDPSSRWRRKHLQTLEHAYCKSPYFSHYWPLVQDLYQLDSELLADLTINQTIKIADHLGLSDTRFLRSSELGITGQKTERLLAICKEIGATHYISGPAARSYLKEELFAASSISVEFMTYDYPVYEQLHPPFDGQVSVLDLLFMVGPDAPEYIWGTPASRSEARHDSSLALGCTG